MPFETRFTWEKLLLEVQLVEGEDFGSLVPLCLGIHSVLWPKDAAESGIRQLQFLGFELLKECEDLGEAERWEGLREFLFKNKAFQLSPAKVGKCDQSQLLMKQVLDQRAGHPMAIVLLVLHFAHYLDLPLTLLRARHYFVLKWVRSGQTLYLDLYHECRALNDHEVIALLNRSSSSLETFSARDLLTRYLEMLAQALRADQALNQLHQVYNLLLSMDDSNIQVLGQRALLRKTLGFKREALADLKRYFSFVEQTECPPEIRQAWMELESAPEPPNRGVTDVLH